MAASDDRRSIIGEFRVTDASRSTLIDYDSDLTPPMEAITVIEAFNRTVRDFPHRDALMFKDEITGEWIAITYSTYQDRVESLAKVFIKLGLERHGTVAVFAFNCAEWLIAELAAIHAGGIVTGIYTTSSTQACLHILESSRANICIVDGEREFEMVREIRDRLPNLKAVVQVNGSSVDGCYQWAELDKIPVDDVEDEYQRRLKSIAVNECCCLIYTSGTVGNPKGVMLSHDNLTFSGRKTARNLENVAVGEEVIVSYLPLAHLAAQMADVFVAISVAATVYFADRDALKSSLVETLRDARPTCFLGVPRVFEKIQEKMMAVGAQSGFVKRKIGAWVKRVALQHHTNQSSNTFQYKLASFLVLSKVRQALGFDRCKVFMSGAAPLNEETRIYFTSLDMPIIEGYGMTEASVATLDGKCMPGTLVKIVDVDADGHGEICIRGRHVFMGYLNDPEKTREAIDDERWMRTGDQGSIDDDGAIRITGRLKELIITAGGENIPYQLIENLIKKECRAISNAVLVGDKRKFLTILLTLKTEMREDGSPSDDLDSDAIAWLKEVGINQTKLSAVLAKSEKIVEAVQVVIDNVNRKTFSNAQRIQKFSILPHDFTIATGELTPTMKVKRNFLLRKYKDVVDKLYQE